MSKPAAPAKPAAPHVAKPMGPNVRMERLASIGDLPSKFKRKPMTAEEMELINVGSPLLRLAFAVPICLTCTLRTHRHDFCDVFALRAFAWDRGRG